MSCKYQKISSNEVGSVISCAGCDELIIGIETVMLKLSVANSKCFMKLLKVSALKAHKNQNDKILLETQFDNLFITFNYRELQKSIELLEFAFLRIEINSLLQVRI